MLLFKIILISLVSCFNLFGSMSPGTDFMMKDIEVSKSSELTETTQKVKVKASHIDAKKPFEQTNFCYLEFSAFPTQISENTFGIAIGYRIATNDTMSNDFSLHVMKNPNSDIHICGKANQLYYLMNRKNFFAPYMGFGIIAGVAPQNKTVMYRAPQYYETIDGNDDYGIFVNGEVVLGVEFLLNSSTRQFFELTYYAQSTTLQMSLGIGF